MPPSRYNYNEPKRAGQANPVVKLKTRKKGKVKTTKGNTTFAPSSAAEPTTQRYYTATTTANLPKRPLQIKLVQTCRFGRPAWCFAALATSSSRFSISPLLQGPIQGRLCSIGLVIHPTTGLRLHPRACMGDSLPPSCVFKAQGDDINLR